MSQRKERKTGISRIRARPSSSSTRPSGHDRLLLRTPKVGAKEIVPGSPPTSSLPLSSGFSVGLSPSFIGERGGRARLESANSVSLVEVQEAMSLSSSMLFRSVCSFVVRASINPFPHTQHLLDAHGGLESFMMFCLVFKDSKIHPHVT